MKYSNTYNSNNYEPALAFFLFSSLIVIVSSCTHSLIQNGNVSFNYDDASGRGPSYWGTLDPKWRNCSDGKLQSPIDIGEFQIDGPLGDLEKKYTSAPAVLINGTTLVEVLWQGNAGRIKIGKTEYDVVNVHWHSPAEHTINGIRYDLELHLVHKSDQNETAVVAMLYRFGVSDPFLTKPDPFLAKLLPSIRGIGEGYSQNKTVGSIHPERIIHSGRSYYRYVGSITAPPCTEGVIWTIFRKVRTVSKEQVEALKQVLPPDNKNNSRPMQALNGRPIWAYLP